MLHNPENLKKEVYNKIGTDFVTNFHYYMWNAWCKEECEAVFQNNIMCEHYWTKWVYLCEKYNSQVAVASFYAELSDEYRYNLVSRAMEKYDGRKERENLQNDLKSSTFVGMEKQTKITDLSEIEFLKFLYKERERYLKKYSRPSNLGIFIAVIGIIAILSYIHYAMRPMDAVFVIHTLSAVIAIVYCLIWYLFYYINRKKMRNLDNLIDQYINRELTQKEIYKKLYDFYNK